MATVLTKTTAPGAYAAAGIEATMQAADIAGNYFISTGKELLIAMNSGSTPRTITITSGPDEFNRAGTITAEAIAGVVGTVRVFGPFPAAGWVQSGTRNILVTASQAEVKLGVITLP